MKSADEHEAKDASSSAPPAPEEGRASRAIDDTVSARPSARPSAPPGAEPEAADGEGAESEPPVEETIACRVAAASDVGLVRDHNEDNFIVAVLGDSTYRGGLPRAESALTVSQHGLLLGVCDGMGGAAAGEVASQTAVDSIFSAMRRKMPPPDRDAFAWRLVRALEVAGNKIYAMAADDRRRKGMGTTATLAGCIDKVAFVGQVGDSRAYVLREGRLELITKDQSLVNQLIEAGQLTEKEAQAFEHSNIILQALGTADELTVDLTFLELRQGDRLLICSDGLSGLVPLQIMQETLIEEADLAVAVERLIELANSGGGHDNVTAIVAEFSGNGLEPPAGIRAQYQQYPLLPGKEEPPDAAGSRGRNRTVSLPQIHDLDPEPTRPGRLSSSAPSAASSSIQPPRERPPYLWWGIGALGLAGLVWALARPEADTVVEVPAEDLAPEETIVLGEPDLAAVKVMVRAPASADAVFVDGAQLLERHGDAFVVALKPGTYRFEAWRRQTPLINENVEVPAVERFRVELQLTAGDAPKPVEREPRPEAPAAAVVSAPKSAAAKATGPEESARPAAQKKTPPAVEEPAVGGPAVGGPAAGGPAAGGPASKAAAKADAPVKGNAVKPTETPKPKKPAATPTKPAVEPAQAPKDAKDSEPPAKAGTASKPSSAAASDGAPAPASPTAQ